MGTRKFKTPGAERQSALEAATQLMAEQIKYEQWLEDLEAKKDSTPAKVFDRVRQDYMARLQTVMEQLGEYTATLHEHAENLEAKLRDLEEAEEANEEEQAEAALRKQVGEMTSAEFDSGSRKAQRELAKIQENQTVILADLNRIRELFGEEEEEEEEEQPKPPKAAKGSAGFNELDFLTSVVGQAPTAPAPASEKKVTPPAAQAVAPTAPAPASPVAPVAAAPRAAPATPRVSNPTPPPAAPVATPSAPVAATPPTPVATPSAPVTATPPTPVAAAPVSPSVTPPAPPAAPKADAAPADSKTLKCQECGTMNSANEWYCERCGAELTVV